MTATLKRDDPHRRQREVVVPAAAYRVVRFADREWRIADDTSIKGVLDLDADHALVLLRRRLRVPRRETWGDALVLRVFHRPRGSAVWLDGSPSVTVPAGLAQKLAAMIQQAGEP